MLGIFRRDFFTDHKGFSTRQPFCLAQSSNINEGN